MGARPLKRFMFSMTVSVFMFSFGCCVGRMCWSLSFSIRIPLCFGMHGNIFDYFHFFSFWIFEQMANTKVKQTVLMIPTRCAQFLLFDVVSFSFFMHSNKSSTSTSWVNKKFRVPFTDCVGYSLSYFILRLMVCRCSSYHIDLVILYDSIQKDANLSHNNNNGDFVDENPISMFHTHVSCTIVPCTMLSALHIIYRINTYISKCKASFCSMCTIVPMFAWKALAKPKTNSSHSP